MHPAHLLCNELGVFIPKNLQEILATRIKKLWVLEFVMTLRQAQCETLCRTILCW